MLPLRATAAELPLAVGVGAGWVWAWSSGRAWVLDGVLEGYRWPDYLYNAWMVGLGLGGKYDPFRNPLHAALLNALGTTLGSFPDAAVVISSAAVALAVLGAGLLARALGGPWAGGAAALVVPLAQPMAEASRWANLYPLLAGASALSVGLTAAALRWPGVSTVALAGLGGGLVWAVDPRGVPFALLAATGVGLGAARRSGGWRGQLAALLVGGAGLGLGPAVDEGFGMMPGRHVDAAEYLDEQRIVVWSWMGNQGDAAMADACADASPELVFTAALWRSPCGAAVVRHNLRYALRRQVALPLWLVAAGGLCLLVPGARGRRDMVDGLLVAGGVFGVAAVGVLTLPLVERYALQLAAPLGAIGCAGLARIATLRGGTWRGAGVAVALVALAWVDRGERARVSATGPSTWTGEMYRWNHVARFVDGALPEGAAFLDCAACSVNLALLPRTTFWWQPPALWQERVDGDVATTCAGWIEEPPARRAYVGVSGALGDPQGSALAARVAADPRWIEVGSDGNYRLYRREE